MKEWVDLYQTHRDLRAHGKADITELRQVLKELGEHNPSVFDKHVQQRLQPEKNPSGDIRTYILGADGREYIATWNLSQADQQKIHFQEAQLTILMSFNSSLAHLHSMTLMVEGKKHDGLPWTIAVHLPDDRESDKNPDGDRQGHGAGGHAGLHCHVGPTMDDHPKVRVPLPPLRPAALLGWLLSQIVPTLPFEPAPWPDVMGALRKTQS